MNHGNVDTRVPTVTMLVRNADDAIRRNYGADETEPQANTPSGQIFTSGDQDERPRGVSPPPVSASSASSASFHALQEWEGYVVDVGTTDFVARLVDLTAGSAHEEEEAVIPRTELSHDDDAKMSVGSIFRWVIGYERSPTGTKKRTSQIVFRDLPAITRERSKARQSVGTRYGSMA